MEERNRSQPGPSRPRAPDDDDNNIVQVEDVFRDLFDSDDETRPKRPKLISESQRNNLIIIICLYINLLTLKI